MQPLQGITVVAVEQAVAAPICTRHLGDLGARVIKVESRAGGGGTTLATRIPLAVALEMGVTGDPITAARAFADRRPPAWTGK